MILKSLSKTPYILLYFVLYRYVYIFFSLFTEDITIHPIKDLTNIASAPIIIFFISGTALICIIPVIHFIYLEHRISSAPLSEFFRILSGSVILLIVSLTSSIYKITIYYRINASDNSWSITVLSIFLSIIALWIYFYYNKIAKKSVNEWDTVIGKIKSELEEDNRIIKEESDILLSMKNKIDSFSSAVDSSQKFRNEIELYYEEIRKSYYSLIKKVPK